MRQINNMYAPKRNERKEAKIKNRSNAPFTSACSPVPAATRPSALPGKARGGQSGHRVELAQVVDFHDIFTYFSHRISD